jgi:hypothetical protein
MQPLGSSRRSTRGRLIVCIALLIVALAVWASMDVWTAPMGLAWHALHGSSVSFEGRSIPVPWDMWVDQRPDSLFMVRWAPKVRLFGAPHGVALILRTRALARRENEQRTGEAFAVPPRGYEFQGTLDIGGSGARGRCWKHARYDGEALSISCRFEEGTLSGSFEGSPKYEQAFYEGLTAVTAGPRAAITR